MARRPTFGGLRRGIPQPTEQQQVTPVPVGTQVQPPVEELFTPTPAVPQLAEQEGAAAGTFGTAVPVIDAATGETTQRPDTQPKHTQHTTKPVSYTHLTLPTILRV